MQAKSRRRPLTDGRSEALVCQIMKTLDVTWADAAAIAISMLFEEMLILALPTAVLNEEAVGAA